MRTAAVRLATAAVAAVLSGSPVSPATMTTIAIRLMMQIDVSSWRYTVNTTIRKKRHKFRARLPGARHSFPRAASTSCHFLSAREAFSTAGDFEELPDEPSDISETVAPLVCSSTVIPRSMGTAVKVSMSVIAQFATGVLTKLQRPSSRGM